MQVLNDIKHNISERERERKSLSLFVQALVKNFFMLLSDRRNKSRRVDVEKFLTTSKREIRSLIRTKCIFEINNIIKH